MKLRRKMCLRTGILQNMEKQRPCYEMDLSWLFMIYWQCWYFYLWGFCSVSKDMVIKFIQYVIRPCPLWVQTQIQICIFGAVNRYRQCLFSRPFLNVTLSISHIFSAAWSLHNVLWLVRGLNARSGGGSSTAVILITNHLMVPTPPF